MRRQRFCCEERSPSRGETVPVRLDSRGREQFTKKVESSQSERRPRPGGKAGSKWGQGIERESAVEKQNWPGLEGKRCR